MVDIIFSGLIALAFLISFRAKVPLISPAYLFLFFSLLYTVFPLLAFHDILPSTAWLLSLNQREDLISIHLISVGFATLCFSYFHARGLAGIYRNHTDSDANVFLSKTKTSENLNEKLLYLFGFCLLVVAGLLGRKYPWAGEEGSLRPELINSFLGQVKIICSTIFIYYFSKFGFNAKSKVFLIAFAFAVILEGSRTSLVALTLAIMIIGARSGSLSLRKSLLLFLSAICAFIFFVFVAIYRLGIDVSSLSLFDATFPLYIEGMYGSYMCLQAYEVIYIKGLIAPTWGLNYLVDPIVFLLPRVFFVALDLDKDNSTLFGNWQSAADVFLDEKFAPYGGFFYVAEAFVAIPFLGPAIVAALFGSATAYFERRAMTGVRGTFNYMIYLVGFFMVFIKHDFSGSSHFLFVTVLSAVIVLVLMRKKNLKSSKKDNYQTG